MAGSWPVWREVGPVPCSPPFFSPEASLSSLHNLCVRQSTALHGRRDGPQETPRDPEAPRDGVVPQEQEEQEPPGAGARGQEALCEGPRYCAPAAVIVPPWGAHAGGRRQEAGAGDGASRSRRLPQSQMPRAARLQSLSHHRIWASSPSGGEKRQMSSIT